MELDLNPCISLTVDAIGKPGQRVFYIQGSTINETATLILEKIQVQSLCTGILRFLNELHERDTNLEPVAGKYSENSMHINPPVDPLFRVGEIGLAYDTEQDKACLIARGINPENLEEQNNEIRYWCTREQLKSLANWGLELVERGRPICPLCGEPIEPTGHFCPKKNGHKKH